MAKVLISDKISESAIQIFKNNNIEVDYKPGISEDELNKRISQISDNKVNKRRGYNKLYMEEVTQADEGVDFKFLK